MQRVTRCARCRDLHHCRRYTDAAILLCAECLGRIIKEWQIKKSETAELSTS